jgi:hypothetical protein
MVVCLLFCIAVWAFAGWQFHNAKTWLKSTGVIIKREIAASPAEGNEWRVTIRYSINGVRYEKRPLMGHFITHGFNLGESVPIVINPSNHQQIQAAPFSPNVYFLAAALFSLLVIVCYVAASR